MQNLQNQSTDTSFVIMLKILLRIKEEVSRKLFSAALCTFFFSLSEKYTLKGFFIVSVILTNPTMTDFRFSSVLQR